MSYQIDYNYHALRVDGTELDQLPNDQHEDRFVVIIETGPSNCYGHSNRRVRDWQVCMIGTHDQVIQQTIRFAAECEGGMLKVRGRDCTPESYIRRIRRILASAEPATDTAWHPHIAPYTDDDPIHTDPRMLRPDGTLRQTADWHRDGLRDFFALVDDHHDPDTGGLIAWTFAKPGSRFQSSPC